MHEDAVLYREYSPNAPWVRLLLWGSLGSVALGAMRSPDRGWLFAVGLLAFGLVLERFMLGLTVVVYRSRIRVGLGRAELVRTEISLDQVARVGSVRYRPLRDFGGWGVRGSTRRRAWTARGDQAVVLHLADDREVYVGSDHPRRLEERIRAAMGPRSAGAHAAHDW